MRQPPLLPLAALRAALSIALLGGAMMAYGTPARAQAGAQAVPLLDGLGDLRHTITTARPLTQRYFDQGLRLAYAFNHDEALRAFREGARIDPDCAMCYWGIALVLGPNINAPMDTASVRDAYQASTRARALAPRVTPKERAFIEALAKRYAEHPPADRSPLDSAYANAMRAVAQRFPDDPDAATLFAESLMDLQPWDFWTRDRRPQPGTAEMVATLERVIARHPRHPGACHYYIHAVEAAYPEKAVACAERLASLMPAAGHLVHMPAHIYIRVGRYNDAIEVNEHAVHADEQYIADQRPSGLYLLSLYPHNHHFLAFAATLAGRSARAIEAARAAAAHTPAEPALAAPELQLLTPYAPLTLATFGRWEDVLREPLPPPALRVATGLAHYARGLAFAATGRWAEAAEALDTVMHAAAEMKDGPTGAVLAVASHALRGEIAARRGQSDSAIAELRIAMRLEDDLGYMEPPYWHVPIRRSLGALLLRTGQPTEAAALYREDLQRFPENGWSLFGLARSLAAQGRTDEARAVEQRFARAWRSADVRLAESRF